MKKLRRWIEGSGMSQNQVAEKLKISKASLSRYVNGSRVVSVKVAVKIEKLTKGKIKCADLI